jgi:hypothetical protein
MSYDLHTKTGSIEAGFWGVDTSRVRLGELPPLTVQQYVGFAAQILIRDLIPKQEPAVREEWLHEANVVVESLRNVILLHSTGEYLAASSDELMKAYESTDDPLRHLELSAVNMARFVPVDTAVYYADNPFLADERGLSVVVHDHDGLPGYEVTAEEFFFFTNYVNHGGLIGWRAAGTYPEVKEAAEQIADALAASS